MTKIYNMGLLAAIVAATADPGYDMFAENAELNELVTDGFVAVNEGMKENGNIAAMATDAGKKLHNDAENGSTATGGATTSGEAAKPKTEKQVFAVTSMKRPDPVKRTRESGESKYPFDTLGLPDADGNVSSFFVPASADMPDPAKSLTSAVSQANRKYGSVTGKNARGHDTYQYTRVFKITPSENPKGAYVWRDADAVPGDASADADNEAHGGEQTTA